MVAEHGLTPNHFISILELWRDSFTYLNSLCVAELFLTRKNYCWAYKSLIFKNAFDICKLLIWFLKKKKQFFVKFGRLVSFPFLQKTWEKAATELCAL